MSKIRQLELLVMLLACLWLGGMAVIGYFDGFAAVCWCVAWVPAEILGLTIAAHTVLKAKGGKK